MPSQQGLQKEEKLQHSGWQRVVLLAVLGYEGAGALFGGSLLIAAPDGRLMDMPVSIMHGAFPDFMIPGLILLALGIGNTVAFFAILRRFRPGWLLAVLALAALAGWFWIEIAILRDVHWLHAMWGLPVLLGLVAVLPMVPAAYKQKALLCCGICSSVLYLAINIIVPLQWKGYSHLSQVVSELSAVGAPTRTLWNILAAPYTLLILAFAWGVVKAAGKNKRLRIAGILLIAYGMLGFLWPFAPMHMRETLAARGGTITDDLHIALGVATEIIYCFALGFAAAALGKGFRIYSIATFVLLFIGGALTFLEAPGIARNEPTPFIGLWERINIGLFLIWVTVLAVILIQRGNRESHKLQSSRTRKAPGQKRMKSPGLA